MNNCIYTPYCTYKQCDLACPANTEISYWMKRCGISMKNPCLSASKNKIDRARELLDEHSGETCYYKSSNPIEAADIFCYTAICLHGRGTALGNGIYHLDYASYIDKIKDSWNDHIESYDLQMIKVWINAAKYLFISNLDYVKFGDFESQTMLKLFNDRRDSDKTTFLISGKEDLIGVGNFFPRLQSVLKGVLVE